MGRACSFFKVLKLVFLDTMRIGEEPNDLRTENVTTCCFTRSDGLWTQGDTFAVSAGSCFLTLLFRNVFTSASLLRRRYSGPRSFSANSVSPVATCAPRYSIVLPF